MWHKSEGQQWKWQYRFKISFTTMEGDVEQNHLDYIHHKTSIKMTLKMFIVINELRKKDI